MKTKPCSQAFTLVELLVVIAIIAVLAAILFPVFAQAKLAAKSTVAISNLKQIDLAWTMYNDAYDDTLMRVRIEAPGKTYYWWGSWDGTRLVPEEGLLFPYMKNAQIPGDPTQTASMRGATGLTGYGYNYTYMSPSTYLPPTWEEIAVPRSASNIESVAETVAFAASARLGGFAPPFTFEGNAYLEAPSAEFPTAHGRHSGGKAAVAWADGHVSSRTPTYRTGSFGWGGMYSGEEFRSHHLGELVAPGCALGSACQDHWFELEKTPTGP